MYILALTGPEFAQEYESGAKTAAGELGASIQTVGPTSINPPAEAALVQQATAQHPGAIVIQPIPASFFRRPMNNAASSGIQVVGMNDAPLVGEGASLFVGKNYYKHGEGSAAQMAKLLGPGAKGQLVLGQCGNGIAELDQSVIGFKKEMASAEPGVEVLGPFTTSLEPSQSLTAWQQLVSSHPNALTYYGVCSPDTDSLIAIKDKTHAKWPLLGNDIDPTIARGVADGTVNEAVSYGEWLESYLATYYAIERAAGNDLNVQGFMNVPDILITKQNIAAIVKREAALANQEPYYRSEINAFLADPTKGLQPLAAASQP